MSKTILLIAFHYPPLQGSSGLLRTQKFAQYLPDFGWQPIVLTVNKTAYPSWSASGSEKSNHPVYRALALDSARHLAIAGRYPFWFAMPDRWISWCITGSLLGLRLIRKHKPSIIWSTYPIATAHLIGGFLSRISGIPWVADFRDSMTEEKYPRDLRRRQLYRRIEGMTVRRAVVSTFTAPGAARMYTERYADLSPERWQVIYNGYDESDFPGVSAATNRRPRGRQRLVLIHSGLLYRKERDPRAFFAAVQQLKRSAEVSADNLSIVLRASGDERHYRHLLAQRSIDDIVKLEPSVPHTEALAEMAEADGLILFQASSCNHQIPAKLYEYLHADRPILALTDPEGDTAGILRESGYSTTIPLDCQDAIVAGLRRFLQALRTGSSGVFVDAKARAKYTRRNQTHELSGLMNRTLADLGEQAGGR